MGPLYPYTKACRACVRTIGYAQVGSYTKVRDNDTIHKGSGMAESRKSPS